MILAIDPGSEQSAWCVYENGKPTAFAKEDNAIVLERVRASLSHVSVVIEMIQCQGMPVGAEVFETCIWIGRYASACIMEDCRNTTAIERITRNQIKQHICRSSKANDATIRQAILDRYGGRDRAIGKKKIPGPLYGMSGDCWAALAVAITAAETSARYQWPKGNA